MTAELNELISVEWYEDCVFQTFIVKTGCAGLVILTQFGSQRIQVPERFNFYS